MNHEKQYCTLWTGFNISNLWYQYSTPVVNQWLYCIAMSYLGRFYSISKSKKVFALWIKYCISCVCWFQSYFELYRVYHHYVVLRQCHTSTFSITFIFANSAPCSQHIFQYWFITEVMQVQWRYHLNMWYHIKSLWLKINMVHS